MGIIRWMMSVVVCSRSDGFPVWPFAVMNRWLRLMAECLCLALICLALISLHLLPYKHPPVIADGRCPVSHTPNISHTHIHTHAHTIIWAHAFLPLISVSNYFRDAVVVIIYFTDVISAQSTACCSWLQPYYTPTLECTHVLNAECICNVCGLSYILTAVDYFSLFYTSVLCR